MIDQEELLARFIDGSLSDEQLVETGSCLRDPLMVDLIVQNEIVDDLLAVYAAKNRGIARARCLTSLTEKAGLRDRQPHAAWPGALRQAARAFHTFRRPVVFAGLVAAIGLMVVVGLSGWREIPTEKSAESPLSAVKSPVARFSRSVNVEWAADARRWAVGDTFHSGDAFELAAGRAELVFDSGAVMTVVGPAALEIRSTTVAALRQGTATTRIDKGRGGEFRVLTPSADVVDLGTEFGVRVEPDGKTDVVVFDGAVDLIHARATNGKSYPSRRLSIGEAVRAGGTGVWERLVSIEGDAFPFGDRIFQVTRSQPPVIAGVSDDRRSPESPKFYCIHHQGLDEDVPAFVDRPYQWNGINEEGIPSFLRGADYIATFNDDTKRELREGPSRITVQLARPAMLYVLYDDRMVVPTWLSESFEDTELDIGLDEGGVNPKRFIVGTGPGNSIDRVCSIWRRRVEQAGLVELGPIGESKIPGRPGNRLGIRPPLQERAMYGIAAKPL